MSIKTTHYRTQSRLCTHFTIEVLVHHWQIYALFLSNRNIHTLGPHTIIYIYIYIHETNQKYTYLNINVFSRYK